MEALPSALPSPKKKTRLVPFMESIPFLAFLPYLEILMAIDPPGR
jgi:hypothetical protein